MLRVCPHPLSGLRRGTSPDVLLPHPRFLSLLPRQAPGGMGRVGDGGVDGAGVFHKVSRIDDTRLAELFAREVLASLVQKELLSPEWAERILSWHHTGFSVHSRVRARTKSEAERVGKYMTRPWTLNPVCYQEKIL